jgi:signal transduction histidine kinase
VTAYVKDGQLHIEVLDNGIGGARADGTGLRGLEDRVIAPGGQIQVDSTPDAGTVIATRIPIPV